MNNYFDKNPLPDGLEPSAWDDFIYAILSNFSPETKEFLWDTGIWIADFWTEYGAWILLIIVVIAFVKLLISVIRRRENNIRKLWTLTVFFLSKRQMMIPLIFTISKREGFLKNKELKELLTIRDECRALSFKKSPEKRIRKEESVSKIIYGYFHKLEKTGEIKKGSAVEKIVKDLEFIDLKLVELQFIYNKEVLKWNKLYSIFPLNVLGKVFRFKKFQLFGNEGTKTK